LIFFSFAKYVIGMTYFQGSTPLQNVGILASAEFETLVKFPNIDQFFPAGSTIMSADVTITFVNWNSPAELQVCFITKPWDDKELKR
jgi:hypothetical protein